MDDDVDLTAGDLIDICDSIYNDRLQPFGLLEKKCAPNATDCQRKENVQRAVVFIGQINDLILIAAYSTLHDLMADTIPDTCDIDKIDPQTLRDAVLSENVSRAIYERICDLQRSVELLIHSWK